MQDNISLFESKSQSKLTPLAKKLCADPKNPDHGLRLNEATGVYVLQKQVNGTRLNLSSKDPVEVWNKYALRITEIEEAKEQAAERAEKGMTLQEAYDMYVSDKDLKPTSANNMHYAMKKVLRAVGEKRMKQITWDDLKDIPDYTKLILRRLYKYYNWKTDNTYDPTYKQAIKTTHKLRQPPSKEIVDAVIKDGTFLPALLLMYTGVRIGEAIALTYSDIDFDNKTITVSKNASWVANKPTLTTPKTKSGIRVIPLIPALEEKLDKSQPGNVHIIGSSLDIPTEQRFRAMWGRYFASIGYGFCGQSYYKAYVTPHQFRHYYVSMLCESGVPMVTAIQLVGHSDSAMIKQVYYHISNEAIHEAGELLTKKFTLTSHKSI